MTLKSGNMTLVSFAPWSQCLTLNESLAGLGYKNINIFRSDDLLNKNVGADEGLFVCLFNKSHSLRDKIISILKHINKFPVLGIFQKSEQEWDREILSYCTEFLNWPCHETELALRLQRLGALPGAGAGHFQDDGIAEEFIGLNLVGSAPVFLDVLKRIKKIAGCDATVLIEGETGTGKEMAARAVHYLSRRRDYPFIPVNCGALPDSLVENELFGHEKGAFTDAKNSRQGLIAQANGGTLFLDEIEALSPKGQVTLLRFLQDQQYRPLGSHRAIQGNIRVITASNANLNELVEKDQFRQDLLFRLNIMSIALPALRERICDVELLAEYFLNQYRGLYRQTEKYLHPATIEWMKKYHWPGNVRELENMIHREFLLAEDSMIRIDCPMPAREERRKSMLDRRKSRLLGKSFNDAKVQIVTEFEQQYLCWLMMETRGNVTLAAKRAGKERRALGKLLKKYGIEKNGDIHGGV